MGATARTAGPAVTALSKIGAGNAKKAEADYSAGVLDQEAGQTVASSIQGMLIERRRKDQVASAAKASLAASGATSTDPSAVKVRGQIEGAAEYQALTNLDEGKAEAIERLAKAASVPSPGT